MTFKFQLSQEQAQFIVDNQFKVIAVQLPDHILAYSVDIVSQLECQFPVIDFAILADTSYGNCCADEVAAQHIDAQAIIHFGEACLSPTTRLPVLYVFSDDSTAGGQQSQLSIDEICSVLQAHQGQWIIVGECKYDQLIQTMISQKLPASIQTRVSHCKLERDIILPAEDQLESHLFCGRALNQNLSNTQENTKVLFIGSTCPLLTCIQMSFSHVSIVQFDPVSGSYADEISAQRLLMRRYYFIEKTKSASIIGILVSTLAVKSYLKAINEISDLIKSVGRTCFIVSVGKLTVAKLANFPEIEVFVNVSCPLSAVVQDNEKQFYQPIITPYELKCALLDSEWNTLKYSLDFERVLIDIQQVSSDHQQAQQSSSQGDDDEEETVFSLATGRYIEKNPKRSRKHLQIQMDNGDQDKSLSIRQEGAIMALEQMSMVVQNRSWNGLDIGEASQSAEVIMEGRSGIAKGYSHETQ
ncbi:hypothetical protein MIR68_003433 [Amoeboaphelidium protococcarum]|nr:hypothetical protein MIR68_003433 [Amoeboaphelidium protococcarum]